MEQTLVPQEGTREGVCQRARFYRESYEARELSSAGSEHLPYKQRVIGSNPIAPTHTEESVYQRLFFCTHPRLFLLGVALFI